LDIDLTRRDSKEHTMWNATCGVGCKGWDEVGPGGTVSPAYHSLDMIHIVWWE